MEAAAETDVASTKCSKPGDRHRRGQARAADALAAIVDGLVQLQAAMQKGETPDPELMNR